MSKSKKQNFFWISYSDLMTSLFFIMMLLFVLSTGSMYLQGKANADQLKKIEEIHKAVEQLPTKYFEEDITNHRWALRKAFSPQFNQEDYNIYVRNDTTKLIEVGNSLIDVVNKLNRLKNDEKFKDMDISFLVVIEGMASRDTYWDNDRLSYQRALSLYYLWKKNGISFEDSQCEVQISGSGTRGIHPYNTEYYKKLKDGDPNANSYYNQEEETKNQCIIIQIIPKISNI